MGTLTLVWGIIFVIAGLYFLLEGIILDPLIALFNTGLGLLSFVPGVLLISIGGILIRKYDQDKKKSKGSDIDKDEKIKDLEKRLEKVEEEKTKSDNNPENS